MAGCLNVLRLILKENWEFFFFFLFFLHDVFFAFLLVSIPNHRPFTKNIFQIFCSLIS